MDGKMKAESMSSSDDNIDDDERNKFNSQGAFLCEICDSLNVDSSAKFKEQSDLVLHTYKNHPTACIGCFETFDTLDDLAQHLKQNDHNLPVCRECWKLVPDESYLTKHYCTGLRFVEMDKANRRNTSNKEIDTEIVDLNSEDENVETEIDNLEEDNDDDEPSGKHRLSNSKTETSPLSINAGQRHSMPHVKCESESEDDDFESMDCTSESESTEFDDDWQGGTSNEKLSCIHCNLDDFCNQKALRLHTMKVHPTVCLICFEGFDNDSNLRNHQKSMKHDPWICHSCDEYFLRRIRYRRHVIKHHPEKCPLRCPDCKEFGCFRMNSMNRHRQTVHGATKKAEGGWKISYRLCDICFKYLRTSYSRVLHMFNEHNEPGQTHVYKCELCDFGFGQGKSFEKHVKEFHSDNIGYVESVKQFLQSTLKRPIKCEICGIETTQIKHILKYHPHLRPHKCHICGLRFSEETDVKVHLYQEHNGPLPFVCPICNLTYRNLTTLRSHLKRNHDHMGMPESYCFKHKQGFIVGEFLTQHIQKWHPEIAKKTKTQYPCPECNKEFTAAGLKRHIQQRHVEKDKFQCDQCGKYFKGEAGLNTHKHHHIRPVTYQCEDCGRSFKNKFQLDRHKVVHTGERPFKCEICGLGFSQISSLQRHVKVVHPNGKLKKGYKPCPGKSRAIKSYKGEETVNKVGKQNTGVEMNQSSRDDSTSTNEVKRNLRKRNVQYKEDSTSSSDESYKPKRRNHGTTRPRKTRKVEQDNEWQASEDENVLLSDSESEEESEE